MKKTLLALSVSTLCVTQSIASQNDLQSQIDQLKEQLEVIAQSVDENQNQSNDFSFGGYGKVDYINYLDKDGSDKTDNYRLVFMAGYKFSDDVSFHSEVEFEHGAQKVEIEQNYISWKLNKYMALSMGTMLVPMGYVSLYHEPTTFTSVNRPETEKYIIPSTWYENGVMVHGSYGDFDYKLASFASFDASKGNEIRDMRQAGINSKAEDFAVVARLDYRALDDRLLIGTSLYRGEMDQDNAALQGVTAYMGDVHAVYRQNAFELKALYAQNRISDANKIAINQAEDSSGKSSGWYLNVAYSIDKFTPFIRYETYNRFEKKYTATTGAAKVADKDITIIALGLNYNIDENVVLKANYLKYDNKGSDDDRMEFGVGYTF